MVFSRSPKPIVACHHHHVKVVSCVDSSLHGYAVYDAAVKHGNAVYLYNFTNKR